jgi:hypothetical protein
MMKMLVDTATPMNGYVHKGDVVDVEEKTSQRWIDHKIAVFVNAEPDELTNADVDELPTSEPEEVKKPAVQKEKKVGRPKKGK